MRTAARMPWSGASFLAYLGGITILFATGALLGVLASDRGPAGFVLLALFVVAVSLVLAFGALLTGHRVTAGLFALTAVVSVVVFAGALLNWFGWFDGTDFPFGGFDLARLFLELLALVASAFALAVFRFPLLVLFLAASTYFFVADLISNGGDWTAIVSILVGFVFLAAAVGIDLGESSYYGLWLHVAAGLAIGGGLLWFLHDGDVDFILVAVLALAYMAIGDGFARSSWIVLGAWGLLQAAEHFATKGQRSAISSSTSCRSPSSRSRRRRSRRRPRRRTNGSVLSCSWRPAFSSWRSRSSSLGGVGTTFRARDSSSSTLEFRA